MRHLRDAKRQIILGGKILHLVWQSSPKWSAAYFGFLILNNVLPTVTIFVLKFVVDAIVQAAQTRSAADLNHFLLLVGLISILRLSNSLVSVLRRHAQNILKDVFGLFMVKSVANHIAELDYSFFEDPKFQDKIEKVRRDADDRPFDSITQLASTFAALATISTVTISMVTIAWWVPVIIFVASLPRIVVSFRHSYKTFRITDRRSPYNREVSSLINFLISKAYAAEVKIFQLKDYLLQKFETIYQRFIKENTDLSKSNAKVVFALNSLNAVVNIVVMTLIGLSTIAGKTTIGSFSFFLNANGQLANSYAELFEYVAGFYENSLFLENYFEFSEIKPKIVDHQQAKELDLSAPVTIEFKNVTFGYSPDKLILKNINFTVSGAQNLAIIGENGAGKTTLIKLLLRLYDVTDGTILLNGVDIRKISLASLHRAISTIFQDFKTYDLSVRENIGFGDIANINNIGRIQKAARLSGAAEFIEKFTEKYKTPLGKSFEGGEELSGGQWQKIAIARAFFKDARVIIMDEPTSALDPKSEYEVFKNLITHTKDKSLILISHRFSTVRLADKIIVLHKGEIIEEGTHETLVKKDGRYAKLYSLQAKWYK